MKLLSRKHSSSSSRSKKHHKNTKKSSNSIGIGVGVGTDDQSDDGGNSSSSDGGYRRQRRSSLHSEYSSGRPRPLPTIYASGQSTKDGLGSSMTSIDNGGDGGGGDNETNNKLVVDGGSSHHNGTTTTSATSTTTHTNNSLEVVPSGSGSIGLDYSNRSEHNSTTRRQQQQMNGDIKEEFTPNQIQPRRIKNSQQNGVGGVEGGANSNKNNWDEDGINRAMAESMALTSTRTMDGDGGDTNIVVGQTQQEEEEEEEEGLLPWNCPACTFLNENPLHLVCGVCGTAKVVTAPKINNSTLTMEGNIVVGGASFNSSFHRVGSSGSFNNYNNNMMMGGSSSFNNSWQNHRRGSHEGGGGGGGGVGHHPPSDYGGGHPDYLGNSFTSRRDRERDRRDRSYTDEQQQQQHEYNNNNFRASVNSYQQQSSRRGSNVHNNDEHSMSSRHQDRDRDRDDRGGGGGGGRRHHNKRKGQRPGRDSLRSSTRSEILDDDSYGSFDSRVEERGYRDHNNNNNNNKRNGGGHNSRDRDRGSSDRQRSSRSDRDERKRYSKSVSHTGGSSSRYRDSDDVSRSSRRSNRSERHRHKKKNDYRRSTMDMGGRNGYHDRDRDRDRRSRYDDDDEDEYDSGGPLGGGGRIKANSDDSDPSDLSEPESQIIKSRRDDDDENTIYRDDKTARIMRKVKQNKVPEGDVTIIYTDVQGSTSLWEADPLAMKKSTDIHDAIMRKCYADHGGYEITTEGDAFNIAFQHPADAIGFALKAQLALYRAKWPEGILNHPDGCDNEKKKFRGFRVRFGMHHGPTTNVRHETTGRMTYQGEAVNIAKAIEKMSHGGQILTTVETWTSVSGMAEQFLGSPQVMDCGEHLLFDPKKENAANPKKKTKRIFSKRIVQLVPNSLSYDFFAARGGQEVKEGETPPRVCGRVFPPLLSHGQLSTSFLNAPYIGNKVAMVFVYTDKMENVTDKERKKNYKILAKYVRSHLMRLSPPGYECQEDKGSWMLAFDRIENGIKFGLDLKEDVLTAATLFGKVDKERAFRVGIHWGPFLSMGPHTVSGHADYFGPIVNRAARVAAQCEPGQVCVGVPMGDGEEPPDPGPSVDVDVLGVKQLKGISIEMAIFACKKRKEDSPTKEETESSAKEEIPET